MRYDYYIAGIHLDVDSEIELDSYDTHEKFFRPILPVMREYEVKVSLVEEITSVSKEEEEAEVRIYPYGDRFPEAIKSCLGEDRIDIYILKKLWKIYMHTFRIWSYIHLERILLRTDALILHSASIISHGKAILFTAPSETGKTTQTDLWHRNDLAVRDLNGDRTILQRTDHGWVACGIPISGTSSRCEQELAPIGAVVLVNRALEDSVSEVSLIQKMQFLYGQITVYSAIHEDAEKALDLLQDFVMSERVVQLNCTMNDSAYEILYHTLELEDK